MDHSATHPSYEPARWISFVRIAQLILTIIVLGLVAYAATVLTWEVISSSYVDLPGYGFAVFAVSWSLVYIPVSVVVFPRLPTRLRPYFIIIGVEALTTLWWLVAFALLGSAAGSAVIKSLSKRSLLPRQSYYDYGYSTSSYGSSSSSSSDLDDYIPAKYKAAAGCTKAAAAMGAFTFVLFVATLIGIVLGYLNQKKALKQNGLGATEGPFGNGSSSAIRMHATENKA